MKAKGAIGTLLGGLLVLAAASRLRGMRAGICREGGRGLCGDPILDAQTAR
jgi:hypothetical protein